MMESNMQENIKNTCRYVPLNPFTASEGFCEWLDSISTQKSKQQEDEE